MIFVAAILGGVQPLRGAAAQVQPTAAGSEAAAADERLRRAAASLEAGDSVESIRIYRELRTDYPEDPRVLLGLGAALTEARRYDEAEALYVDMEARRVDPIGAHLGRARLRELRGELREAEKYYRNVLQAAGDQLDARIGLARVKHLQGLNRSALDQTENIVFDHPESDRARELVARIRLALRPTADLEPVRFDDGNGGRVDSATAAYTFFAEPQTSIGIEIEARQASFRCKDRNDCDGLPGSGPVNQVVEVEAQTLMAGLTSRLIAPLAFHARLGAVRQESFDGEDRTILVGGAYIRWRVGPRLEWVADGSRRAMMDNAELIDRGLRLDVADLKLNFRFRPAWMLEGEADYGSYSDGNARETVRTGVKWSASFERLRIDGTVNGWYRRFHDDLDHGYFDPIRYLSARIGVDAEGDTPGELLYWRFNGMVGWQDFDMTVTPLEATSDDSIRTISAALGIRFGERARTEAFWSATDDPLVFDTGFDSRRYGMSLRLWI